MAVLSRGIKCERCEETFHYDDEIVFLLGNDVVHIDEQYPDWNRAICTTCAEEKGLI